MDVTRAVMILSLVMITIMVSVLAISDDAGNIIWVVIGLAAGLIILWLDNNNHKGSRPRRDGN